MAKKNNKKKYKLTIEKVIMLILIVAMLATSVLAIFA